LTLVDVGPERTRRKISGLHNQKEETEPSTLGKSITTREEVTHARGEVEGEAKKDHCIVCT
jgi:hypothetical protein